MTTPRVGQPWLTVIIDDYSRAIAGFFFSFESPSALQTALVLRQAIRRKSDVHWIISGIPEILYTDDASDFTSAHLEQVAADIRDPPDLFHAGTLARSCSHRVLL